MGKKITKDIIKHDMGIFQTLFGKKAVKGLRTFKGIGYTEAAAERSARSKIQEWKHTKERLRILITTDEEEVEFIRKDDVNTVCYIHLNYRQM